MVRKLRSSQLRRTVTFDGRRGPRLGEAQACGARRGGASAAEHSRRLSRSALGAAGASSSAAGQARGVRLGWLTHTPARRGSAGQFWCGADQMSGVCSSRMVRQRAPVRAPRARARAWGRAARRGMRRGMRRGSRPGRRAVAARGGGTGTGQGHGARGGATHVRSGRRGTCRWAARRVFPCCRTRPDRRSRELPQSGPPRRTRSSRRL